MIKPIFRNEEVMITARYQEGILFGRYGSGLKDLSSKRKYFLNKKLSEKYGNH